MLKKWKKKKRNRGFTLVEVMVAAAILSLVVTPILSSFVAIARVNAKSRQKLSATTIADGIMESVKGFDLLRVAKECDFSAVPVTVICGFTGTASELDGASVELKNGKYVFKEKASGTYKFKYENIAMDGTYYDAYLTYTKRTADDWDKVVIPSTTPGGTATVKTPKAVFDSTGVRVLTFYDVEIKVFRHGVNPSSGKALSVITGTKADYN